MAASKAGAVLAKVLGIDLDAAHPDRHQTQELRDHVARGLSPCDPFYEAEPTVKEWFLEQTPTRAGSVRYVKSLFPCIKWLPRYNTRWLISDLIAGVTLGLVVIPQAMAYALLANLSPEYGLYTSFTGASLYWLFGTSKDIAIGATAVVSLLVGKVIHTVQKEHPGEFAPEEISKTLAFLGGVVLLVFGLLRLDWVIEFIPPVAISAFVTGAAITISLSQLPSLLGITGVNSKGSAYRVFIDTCRSLPRTKLDAAIGLTALVLLSLIKWYTERMARNQPQRKRMWEMLCSLRMTFTILLYTLISFLVNRGLDVPDHKFRLTGPLPQGFTHAGPPSFNGKLITAMLPELPAAVIILVIEHIAIGKSFGRINNYTVQPSQELISIGCTNLLGPFVGAYSSTGSFGGTAILSKAGSRTPLAGIFNGVILLLALYALTSVLYFIPMASLAALIIHAVINLIPSPDHSFHLWLMSPPDVFIYASGVVVSIFTNLENGIYATVAMSAALLLLRLARARGRFLGVVRTTTTKPKTSAREAYVAADGDCHCHDHDHRSPTSTPLDWDSRSMRSSQTLNALTHCQHDEPPRQEGSPTPAPHTTIISDNSDTITERELFLPLDRDDGTNPAIRVEEPLPGVIIYRFTEGFNYLNQAQYVDTLMEHIREATRRTAAPHYDHPGDRPWNEPAPQTATTPDAEGGKDAQARPILKAIVLDCAAVNIMDSGAIEGLSDLRNQVARWAAPGIVEWHFAAARSRWSRRGLAAVGFGAYPPIGEGEVQGLDPVFTFAQLDMQAQQMGVAKDKRAGLTCVPDMGQGVLTPTVSEGMAAMGVVDGLNRPFFHADLATAVDSAVRSATRRDGSLV